MDDASVPEKASIDCLIISINQVLYIYYYYYYYYYFYYYYYYY